MTRQEFICYLKASIDRVASMSYYKKTERVFCYELYHQMRLLKDDNLDIYYPQFQAGETGNLIISSEIRKNTISAYPDFVFHNDPNFDNEDLSCQFAAIEVKLAGSPSKNVKKDLKKLYTMLIGGLQYQIGILLYVGQNQHAFINKIASILQEVEDINDEDYIDPPINVVRVFLQNQVADQRIHFIFKQVNGNNFLPPVEAAQEIPLDTILQLL